MAGAERHFRPAKIFRRTGRHSYAVQLEGCPGVVEVHCVSEDWGYMTSTWKRAEALEDRLCAIGTRRMFCVDKKCGIVSLDAMPIDFWEGVCILLGPYDAGRCAFVQCKLEVDSACLPPKPPEQTGELEGSKAARGAVAVHPAGMMFQPDGSSDHAPREKKRRRRFYKWE